VPGGPFRLAIPGRFGRRLRAVEDLSAKCMPTGAAWRCRGIAELRLLPQPQNRAAASQGIEAPPYGTKSSRAEMTGPPRDPSCREPAVSAADGRFGPTWMLHVLIVEDNLSSSARVCLGVFHRLLRCRRPRRRATPYSRDASVESRGRRVLGRPVLMRNCAQGRTTTARAVCVHWLCANRLDPLARRNISPLAKPAPTGQEIILHSQKETRAEKQ